MQATEEAPHVVDRQALQRLAGGEFEEIADVAGVVLHGERGEAALLREVGQITVEAVVRTCGRRRHAGFRKRAAATLISSPSRFT